MIQELIEPKKKTTVRNSPTTNAKTLNNDNCPFDQSDSETVKEPDSGTTTFIPPWLRNSLSLIQRHSQSDATFDQKPTKIIPSLKEQNGNEFDSVKKNIASTKVSDHLETLPNYTEEEVFNQDPDGVKSYCDNVEKQMAVFWSARQKESETESTCTNGELKILTRGDSKMTNTDVRTSAEIGKLKDDERKRLKFIKQRNKIRKRIMSEHRTGCPKKNEVGLLLEMRARQVLDDYMRKEVHSMSSDTKLMEAKMILLGGKCRDDNNPAFTQEEMLLLQEMKEKAGNREELDRLMDHVTESNLREMTRNSESLIKALGEKGRKCEDDGGQNNYDEEKPNGDKDSLASTDDENDIKRFSEFLSKNKNLEEKRKCLEEVRNYFERKRRTRLTKRRHVDESKTPRRMNSSEKRDEGTRERPKTKEMCTMTPGREKKSKFDEGIVDKAVSETLQKFVDFYHFHVSPTVMGSMKKNILQALQSDAAAGGGSSKHNLGECKFSEGRRTDKSCKDEAGPDQEQACEISDPDTPTNKTALNNPRGARRKTFKTPTANVEQAHKSESEAAENEIMKRLKKELESCSNSIQARADVAKFKLQSIILEREDQSGSPKSLQCVYNCSRKALEFLGETCEREKTKRDTETQSKPEAVKKTVKLQTSAVFGTSEQSLQTEEKACVARDAQTENAAVTEIGGVSLCPGLYRVLKSKEGGKFYLQPEKLDDDVAWETGLGKSVSSKASDSDPKPPTREKTSKERRIIRREKERGRGKQRSKKQLLASASQSLRATRKETANGKLFNNSISCLFFRNFSNHNVSNCLSEDPPQKDPESNKEAEDSSTKENHSGCVWFWNGKKISAGFDLKNLVEDLLKEKLKEIRASCSERFDETGRNEVGSTKNEENSTENCQTVRNKDLDVKNTSATIFFRDSGNAQEESSFMFIADGGSPEFGDKTLQNEGAVGKEEANEETVSFKETKSVRDASTQNSQQTFLSLNIKKANSRSKTSCISQISKSEHRKGKLAANPLRKANLTKTSDFMKAVRGIKRMKIEVEDNALDSGSTFEESSGSSGATKSYADPLTLIVGLKNKAELVEAREKMKRMNGAVNRECQTKDGCEWECENWDECPGRAPELDDQKQWDLIESVLNRVNQKERQSLWNDLRQFIKTKIGRDINDEGAKEVCIEIEQDVPKSGKEKFKPRVQATGRYTRNEGDVEVELDLTLDDLESILRRRQRKNRRQKIRRGSKATRGQVSSSSGQSDFTKADLRRYQKCQSNF